MNGCLLVIIVAILFIGPGVFGLIAALLQDLTTIIGLVCAIGMLVAIGYIALNIIKNILK